MVGKIKWSETKCSTGVEENGSYLHDSYLVERSLLRAGRDVDAQLFRRGETPPRDIL